MQHRSKDFSSKKQRKKGGGVEGKNRDRKVNWRQLMLDKSSQTLAFTPTLEVHSIIARVAEKLVFLPSWFLATRRSRPYGLS